MIYLPAFLLPTYLPLFFLYGQKSVKMTSQMVLTKKPPSHIKHVKIDLSKMTNGLLNPCPIWYFLTKNSSKKTKFFTSATNFERVVQREIIVTDRLVKGHH
jgi:hypothetical protein